MLNLKVFDKDRVPYYLDLYDTEPLKLNFSIEDIQTTDPKSTFSRVFRVPSTSANNEFFKNAFLIEGIDYDVTVKVPAEIEVGGVLFRTGHIRLQNIFRNEELDRIDYEILYLGEIRDLSSIIGERSLCELDGSSLAHELTVPNIITSWSAFPQGTSGNSGLLGGNIIYPLVDHGNTYSGTTPQEAEIRTVGSNPFTVATNPITPDRLKPMIRAKKIIDLIFESTPYTYTSNFFNSLFFQKIYVSAWGNDASPSVQLPQSSALCQVVTQPNVLGFAGVGPQLIPLTQKIYDIGNNFTAAPGPPPPFAYVAPIAGIYSFTASAYLRPRGLPFSGPVQARVELWVNGAVASQGPLVNRSTSDTQLIVSLNPGDYVQLYVRWNNNIVIVGVEDATFTCTGGPGDLVPTFLLDCEYKQIDFLRDILKIFRCVLVPDEFNPDNFIIEPWLNYVTTGRIYDWSEKVDRTRDFVIEPLFFTQTDEIKFKFSEDEDWLNQYNQDTFKQVYGQLTFDSENELLKDTRDIEVGFAPTPTTQITGEGVTSDWIIPHIYSLESDGATIKYEPIKPVTRILFYNGLVPTPLTWYMTDGTISYLIDEFPQVSYLEGVPPNNNGLNLNWDRWFPYWGNQVPGYSGLAGQSLYERYWTGYINSLYNKFARRVTVHVLLNSVDLQDFSFRDVIQIDGVYYIPEKIIDAPIGERSVVKVELIKLLDFRPPDPAFPPLELYYYLIQETDCDELTGDVYVMQSTVPINLGDFVHVQEEATCYQVISPSSDLIPDKIYQTTWIDCVTCVEGDTPLYVYYVEQYGTCGSTFAPGISVSTTAPLTPGDTVELSNIPGCWKVISRTALVPVDTVALVYLDCESCLETSPTYLYQVTNCLDPLSTLVVDSDTPLGIGSVVTCGVPGCWTITGYESDTPTSTIVSSYATCEECLAANEELFVYDLVNCETAETTVGVYTAPLSVGQAVNTSTLIGCWEITGVSASPPLINIVTIFPDCATCNALEEEFQLPVS